MNRLLLFFLFAFIFLFGCVEKKVVVQDKYISEKKILKQEEYVFYDENFSLENDEYLENIYLRGASDINEDIDGKFFLDNRGYRIGILGNRRQIIEFIGQNNWMIGTKIVVIGNIDAEDMYKKLEWIYGKPEYIEGAYLFKKGFKAVFFKNGVVFFKNKRPRGIFSDNEERVDRGIYFRIKNGMYYNWTYKNLTVYINDFGKGYFFIKIQINGRPVDLLKIKEKIENEYLIYCGKQEYLDLFEKIGNIDNVLLNIKKNINFRLVCKNDNDAKMQDYIKDKALIIKLKVRKNVLYKYTVRKLIDDYFEKEGKKYEKK